MTERIKVIVRCRPLNQREIKLRTTSIISANTEESSVELADPSNETADPRRFTFDAAYGPEITTNTIYDNLIYPLIEDVLTGYNATIFAYGQTGCGKSFTMEGPEDIPDQQGIIPKVFEQLFESISVARDTKYLLHASYMEIYNENLHDLLDCNTAKLEIAEHPQKGVYVTNISRFQINSIEKFKKLMAFGKSNRAIGETQMNRDSSRSHAIFIIDVEASIKQESGKDRIIAGRLNLVDLAGSERQSKTESSGIRFQEAIKINLSLSALGNVISSLVEGKRTHIPYRDSKLTRLLQNSLGGNSKTIMIACISPSSDSFSETLNTLRYANRAKNIKNAPKVNEDPRDALLKQYRDEIERLKATLEGNYDSILSQHSSRLQQEHNREIESLRAAFESEKQSWLQTQTLQNENAENQSWQQPQTLQNENVGKQSGMQPQTLQKENVGKQSGLQPQTLQKENVDTKVLQDRLSQLENCLVGGEEANNQVVRAKRQKRKKWAEEIRKMTELKDVFDDDPLMSLYHKVQNKVIDTSIQFERQSDKLKQLKNELQDTKDEFAENQDGYLDTIRQQAKQIDFLNSYVSKINFCVPKESNYSNFENVRAHATWDDDSKEWTLPPFLVDSLSLPSVNTTETPRQMLTKRPPSILNRGEFSRSYSLGEGQVTENARIRKKPSRLNPL